ncbi:MAG: branched-chain amino acid ABC transporter permease [Candidatus Rokubacteria bacterium]|nr:branched-chain amino acid ABC transporter permease [Candidatus Rokubacteria bacterium]
MSDFALDVVQQVLNGFLFGSSYALIGIGFTMIFGVMEKLNLAFGVTGLAGAYTALWVFRVTQAPFAVVFLAAVVSAGLIGLVIEYTCFRWMPRDYPLAPLMATMGMLFFVEEIIVHSTHGRPQAFPAPLGTAMMDLGPWLLRGDLGFRFLVSLVVMALLWALVYKTRLGLATRAVSQQPVAAQLCGIGLRRVNAAVFVITGMVGGVAGALIGSAVGNLSPLLSLALTVKGLVTAVLGGLGSIPGAIVAGLVLGVVEYEALYFFGIGYRDMVTYLLLFVFLIFRPGGLFGRGQGA